MKTLRSLLLRIVTLCTLMLLSSPVFAQPTPVIWQRLLDKTSGLPDHFQQSDATVADAEPTHDGGAVIAVSGSRPYIAQIDGTGQLKWAKTYEIGTALQQISETADGDFIGVGVIHDSNGFYFVIAEIAPDGILKKLRRVSFLEQANVQTFSFFPNLLATADGGFLVGCNDSFFNFSPEAGQLYTIKVQLLKMDLNGETQWQKVFGTNGTNRQTYLRGLMQEDNGSVRLSLSTNAPEVLNFDPGNNFYPFGLLLNAQGDILQSNVKVTGNALRTTQGQFVDVVPTVTSPHMFNVNWYDANLTFLQTQLFTFSFFQWAEFFQRPPAFYPTPDGGVLVGDPWMDPNFKADFRLTKFSADMRSEWQQVGGGNGNDVIQVIRISSDGQYLIVGRTDSPESTLFGQVNNPAAQTIWIRKQAVAPTGGADFSACFEAENAVGSGSIYENANASGGKAKGQYGNAAEHLVYSVTGIPSAGTYTLQLRFQNGESPIAGIIVNGGPLQNISLPKTGSGFGEVSLNVTLNEGNNTLRIQGGPGGAFNQDKICLSKKGNNSTRKATVEQTFGAEDRQWIVYPNPAAGHFKMRFYAAQSSQITLKVSDLSGRTLAEKQLTGRGELQEETIALAPSVTGTVLVTLSNGMQRLTKTVVINP